MVYESGETSTLFNKDGELVGIVVRKVQQIGVDGLNFAVPHWIVEDFIDGM